MIESIPRPLALLLVIGALLSLAWDVATPPLEGPDEAKHFAYLQYLAETGHLPRTTGPNETLLEVAPGSTEVQGLMNTLDLRPTITNRRVRPAWSGVDLNLWRHVERSMPRGSRSNGGDSNPLAKNPPLYYAVMAIPYRMVVWLPLIKRVFALRLFNALFYLATIVLMWLLAGEVFGRVRWKQALAAGVVALEPQVSFMSSAITPENLSIALTTGFLLASVRLVKLGPSLVRVLLPGVLAAAAVLTHGRQLVLLPVLAVVLAVTWIRHRPAARETLTFAAVAAPIGVAFAAYVLFGKASGSRGLYGGQVSELNTKTTFKLTQFISNTWDFYFEKFVALHERIGPKWGYRQVYIEGFYGGFGSGNVTFPKGVLAALQAFTAVGLAGLCAAAVACWRRLRQAWPLVLVFLSLAVTTIAFLHYVNYRSVLVRGTGHLFIGRYLLPMVALFGLAVTFSVGALPRRAGPLLGAALLGCAVVLCFTGITVSMFRFYG